MTYADEAVDSDWPVRMSSSSARMFRKSSEVPCVEVGSAMMSRLATKIQGFR